MSHRIIPIESPPERTYTKGSIYDPVIDEFIESGNKLSRVEMTKKDGTELDGTYLTGQLKKRMKQRKMITVKARTINKKAHIETVE